MIYPTLAIFNSLFFIGLTLLHLNWLLGGSLGGYALIPTDGNNRMLYKPNGLRVVIQSVGFLCFTVINLAWLGAFGEGPIDTLAGYGVGAIGTLLLVRAIGDFAYVGFSKRYYNSRFSNSDTKIFSPVCLLLALFHFALL